MKHYVCGFLFTNNERYVALIRKNKPAWQEGLWNGIGGKIEHSESPMEAMIREFKEETGYFHTGWTGFATLQQTVRHDSAEWWLVHFFTAHIPVEMMNHIATTTKELVMWHQVAGLPTIQIVPNLKWLIPLALETGVRGELQQVAWQFTE